MERFQVEEASRRLTGFRGSRPLIQGAISSRTGKQAFDWV